MDQKDTGAAGSPEQAKPAEAKVTARGPAKASARNAPGQEATAQAIREAARDFSMEMAGSIRQVLNEQNALLAQQLRLKETDIALVQELLAERSSRQASDEALRQEIERKAEPRKRDRRGPRVIDADPEQLLLALQFNALSSVLGSRKRIGSQRENTLIPSPEILGAGESKSASPYLLKFVAPLPEGTETVVVKFLEGPRDQVPADDVSNGYLGLDSDQVQYVELLDGQATPIALGIPFRR
ncbi:hypothetical protein [Arthrobacter sp. UYEF36]|uniref:hypothetical protein n=1 Tax=Arthrobacter sp. UYEF36 TaxID=1756366 RepID=UPI003398A771